MRDPESVRSRREWLELRNKHWRVRGVLFRLTKHFGALAGIVSAGLLAGCAVAYNTYSGIKPISPKPRAVSLYSPSYYPVKVTTLRPTFRWHTAKTGLKVDLAIWEAFELPNGGLKRGEAVLLLEGLTGNEHALDEDLRPATVYLWSLKETGAATWSTIKQSGFVVTGVSSSSSSASGFYFAIRTPGEQE